MLNYLYNLATDKYNGFFASILKAVLFILSLIYGLIIRLMIFFQRLVQIRLDCKVISVGNITVGGTGKTTVVEYICRHLRESGHKVAIVTRGYKRNTAPYVPGAVSYENMGDEAYMPRGSI